ncbi:MAG TPA: hypothetical protein VLA49_10675 [Anaerolineales bacterium]|nr:hypothetical protein [Anaerolineales bacterium]
MRKIIFLALIVALALAACGGEKTEPSGTYNMVSIDGNELPYAPTHEGQQGPEIVGGSLTLEVDGTFAFAMDYQIPGGKMQSSKMRGDYTIEASECTLKWQGAGMTACTWEGDQLSFNNEGLIFAFQRAQN